MGLTSLVRPSARRLRLSPAAGRVVAGAVVGGGLVLIVALFELARTPSFTSVQLVLAGTVGVLLACSWVWPLRVFVGKETRAVHFDEASLVVLALLVPAAAAAVAFAATAMVAQAVKRQSLVKSTFNVGQVMLAAGAGLAVFRLVSPAPGLIGPHGLGLSGAALYGDLGAAALAAVVYSVVNAGAVMAVVVANGTPWRTVLRSELESNVAPITIPLALAAAIVMAADPWLTPIVVLPALSFQHLMADRFEARRDRVRVRELFDATMEANRSMGESDVTEALLSSARRLFGCSTARLTPTPRFDGVLQARLPGGGPWLSVSGRTRTEPYTKADQALLDTLAAVAAGALRNAWLYQEGRRQREQLSAITSSMGEGVCAVSETGEITFLNPSACAMLGWQTPTEPVVSGQNTGVGVSIGPGFSAPSFLAMPVQRCLVSQTTVTNYDARFVRSDGSSFHVAYTASPIVNGRHSGGAVVVFRDISERKAFEEQLARHAFHDSLTGLPNRRLFLDHLDHALRRAARSGEMGAVLFADVDRFKLINDSLGHAAGDHLLVAIARRVQACLRAGDVLARFGGDEFTVLLEQISGAEEAVAVAERIIEAMSKGVALPDGHEVVATLSIGIALTVPGKSRDDLLHDADVAMYRIKGKGRRGQFELFDAEAMGVRSAERIELETSLRQAVQERQLEVHYQPLFSVSRRTIVGAEALVRWNHPERGMLAPASFIELAEDSGLILPLGRQVLEDACRQARRWDEAFGVPLVVSVNLSARQFQQSDLVEEVQEVLRLTGVNPRQLSLEITESLAMDDVVRTREMLFELKALGVGVAIDDFGTGYSALGYLTQFPVDVVKIDRSFVEGVDVDPVKSAIVAAVVNLSNAIGTTTVVEGVETKEQLDHLESLGCREAQGFHLAPPMPAAKFDALVRRELTRSRGISGEVHQLAGVG